jgi:hypothetical protein
MEGFGRGLFENSLSDGNLTAGSGAVERSPALKGSASGVNCSHGKEKEID